jgi:hypothetical protein
MFFEKDANTTVKTQRSLACPSSSMAGSPPQDLPIIAPGPVVEKEQQRSAFTLILALAPQAHRATGTAYKVKLCIRNFMNITTQ